MNRLLFGAFLVFLVTACAPCMPYHEPPRERTVEIPVWVDARFNMKDRVVIRDAFEHWNRVLNGYARFYVVSENFAQPSVQENVKPGEWTVDWESEDVPLHVQEHFMAWVPEVGIHEIHVVNGFVVLNIVEHEIGHGFGLKHSTRIGDLMAAPYPASADCIDDYTVRRLAWLKIWDPNRMNPECHR